MVVMSSGYCICSDVALEHKLSFNFIVHLIVSFKCCVTLHND